MDISYNHEKFWLAVTGMVHSPLPLRQRLRDAYIHHLMYVHDEDLPVDSRFDMAKLREMLTSKTEATETEGPVQATTDHMSDDEADHAAHLITKIFHNVESRYWGVA